MLVVTNDSFVDFDIRLLNEASWPGCSPDDCKVDALFEVWVDGIQAYAYEASGLKDWYHIGGIFVPAGEHLIEFTYTNVGCQGAGCGTTDPAHVAKAWLDAVNVRAADPADTTDSDGDGVSDYDEQFVMNTDPMRREIIIDVLPDSAANVVYPNKAGNVPVVILSSPNFDASQVDAATLRFGYGQAKAKPPVVVDDVDGLHGDDMRARFGMPESGIVCNDTDVSLSGETNVGGPFVGIDAIDATQCVAGGCHAY